MDSTIANYGETIQFGSSDEECVKLGTDGICKEANSNIGSCCMGGCGKRKGVNNGFCKLKHVEGYDNLLDKKIDIKSDHSDDVERHNAYIIYLVVGFSFLGMNPGTKFREFLWIGIFLIVFGTYHSKMSDFSVKYVTMIPIICIPVFYYYLTKL